MDGTDARGMSPLHFPITRCSGAAERDRVRGTSERFIRIPDPAASVRLPA